MLQQRGDGTFLFLAIGVLLLISVSACMDRASCHAAWAKSGYPTSWGPLQGCLIQLPDGRWVPESRVREIDPKKN